MVYLKISTYICLSFMKRISNISLSFTLILALLFGYTGIPVYKMMCGKDGKMTVSIVDLRDECKHDAEKHPAKGCCEPSQKQETPSCCDHSATFFQLHEATVVSSTQNTTGHLLLSYDCIFNDLQLSSLFNHEDCSPNSNAPLLCKVKAKQSKESITQNFRI
jgi:hypothetical protein